MKTLQELLKDSWVLEKAHEFIKANKDEFLVNPNDEEAIVLFAANCEDAYMEAAQQYNETLCSEAAAVFGHVSPEYFASETSVVFGLEWSFSDFLKWVELQKDLSDERCDTPRYQRDLEEFKALEETCNPGVLATDELNELFHCVYIYNTYYEKNYEAYREQNASDEDFEELPF